MEHHDLQALQRPYNQVVLFGDSLFQNAAETFDGYCFDAALQSYCLRRLDVINRGLSGYNSRNALQYLEKVFLPPSPTNPRIEALIILLGPNDACMELPTTTQHVPLDEYRENLIKIMTHPYITAHKPKILLVNPPPIDEIRMTELDLAWGHPAVTRQAAVSAKYSQAAREAVAQVPGAVLIDLYKAVMDKAIEMTPDYDPKGLPLGYPGGKRGALEQLLPDGLHIGSIAYKMLFEMVKPHIGPFPGPDVPFPDNCKGYVFPSWNDLNKEAN